MPHSAWSYTGHEGRRVIAVVEEDLHERDTGGHDQVGGVYPPIGHDQCEGIPPPPGGGTPTPMVMTSGVGSAGEVFNAGGLLQKAPTRHPAPW